MSDVHPWSFAGLGKKKDKFNLKGMFSSSGKYSQGDEEVSLVMGDG